MTEYKSHHVPTRIMTDQGRKRRISFDYLIKNLGCTFAWGNNVGKLARDGTGFYLEESHYFPRNVSGGPSENLAALPQRTYISTGDILTRTESVRTEKFRVMSYAVDLEHRVKK